MRAVVATLVVLGIAISSAVSSVSAESTKPAGLEELVKTLSEKLEKLEKRLAALEAENKELRAAIAQPRVHIILAPQEKKQDRPRFHLLNHTEIGVPFDVERAMMIPRPNAVLR